MLSSLLFWRQRRYIMCFLALIGFSLQYMMRVNLSVAILDMVEENNRNKKGDNKLIGWSASNKSTLIGIFFYGYILTQFSGGYLADRIGGKKVLFGSVLSSSILSLFTPLCAKSSVPTLFIVRFLIGLSQGVMYPSVYPTLRKWAPPWERGQLCLIVFTGNYVGTTIGLLLSGVIISKIGWPWVFYIFGIFGIVWCITWQFGVSESPVNDKRISRQELLILQEALNTLTRDYNPQIPWKKLFKSVPVWAIAAADFGNSFGYYLVLTQYSVYLNDVHYPTRKIDNFGLIASIPHIIMIFTSLTSGYMADLCIKKEWMSVTVCRKVFTCGAFLVQAITSIAAATATNTTVGLILIILNVSVGAIGWAGYSVNHLDICPQYGGISMGLANTFGTMPGILMTLLINFFVSDDTIMMAKYTKWRVIFLITTAFCLLGFIVYALCASGERQPWAMNIYRHKSSMKSIKSDDENNSEEDIGGWESGENVILILRRNDKTDNEGREDKETEVKIYKGDEKYKEEENYKAYEKDKDDARDKVVANLDHKESQEPIAAIEYKEAGMENRIPNKDYEDKKDASNKRLGFK